MVTVVVILGQILGDVVIFRVELGHGLEGGRAPRLGSGGGCLDGLDCGLDLSLAGQIVAGQVVEGSVEGGESFALVGADHRSGAVDV